MVSDLAALGADVVLLTGDHQTTAGYFADQIGITDVQANLMPEGKEDSILRI